MLPFMPELQITTVGERDLVMTREFNAPRDLVFACYTRPELIRRWLLGPEGWSMPVCEFDARIGGKYRYVWRHNDGRETAVSGVLRDIAPPEKLVSTELFDDDWTGGEALTSLVLTDRGGRTLMTQTVTYSSAEARAGALASGMTSGLEMGFQRLDAVLGDMQED